MIFESVARTEVFGALIERTDEAIRLSADESLTFLASEFEDAAETMLRMGDAGLGADEIRFSFDTKARLVTATASAISVFGLEPGQSIMDHLGDNGRSALEDLIGGRRSQASFTLFTYARLRPVPVSAQSNGRGGFDAIAVNIQWNRAVAPHLMHGFQLSESEVEVVELLFRGYQLKEIARRRGSSVETVRTQVRAICRKTDTHGQFEILHLVYSLIATIHFMQAGQTAQAHGNYFISLPSGRRMDVEVTGPENGKPLLFLHGCLGGRRLSDDVLSRLRGRRIIAPGRPGHGQPPADGRATVRDIVKDVIHVLDYFGIRRTDVLSYDLGAPFA